MKHLPIFTSALLAALWLCACTVTGDVDTFGNNNNSNGGADAGPTGGNGSDAAPGGGDAGALTPNDVLLAFGGCMQLADFQGPPDLGQIALITAAGGGNCTGCHDVGGTPPVLSADSATTFAQTIANAASLRSYVTVDAQLNMAASTLFLDKSIGAHAGGNYTLPQDLADGIAAFYAATKLRYDQNGGNCPQ